MSAVCGVGKLGTTWMLIIQQTEEINLGVCKNNPLLH